MASAQSTPAQRWLARLSFVLAGLAIGVAAAAKATAWPAVVVIGVLILVRDGRVPLMRFLVAAVAACGALIGPVAVLWPGALVARTVFRHKRRKLGFSIITALIVLLHLAIWSGIYMVHWFNWG